MMFWDRLVSKTRQNSVKTKNSIVCCESVFQSSTGIYYESPDCTHLANKARERYNNYCLCPVSKGRKFQEESAFVVTNHSSSWLVPNPVLVLTTILCASVLAPAIGFYLRLQLAPPSMQSSPQDPPPKKGDDVDTDTNISNVNITNSKSSTKHKRRMSFTSAAMGMKGGPFPDSVELSETIIHTLVSFPSIAECPTTEEVIPMVEMFLRDVDRMAGIPKYEHVEVDEDGRGIGKKEWHFEKCVPPIDPKRMIRTFEVDHDALAGMSTEVEGLRKTPYDLMSEERNLPWWEICLLRNKGKSESMLVFRVNHVIGDGLSLGRLMMMVMTRLDGSPVESLIPKSMMKAVKQTGKNVSIWKKIYYTITAVWEIAMAPIGRWDHPIAFNENIIGPNVDSKNRKIICFDPYPIDYIKAIKNKAGASLSGVLNAAMGQAVYDFCRHSDCPEIQRHGERLLCRAYMMVGFPSEHEDINVALHNGWGPVSIDLGVGFKCLKARLQRIEARLAYIKNSPLAPFQIALLNKILVHIPIPLYKYIVQKVCSKFSLSTTCVPGPSHPILVAGKPVSACRFTLHSVMPVIGFLSYDDEVYATLNVDDEAIPGIKEFPNFFTKALIGLGNEFDIDVPPSLKEFQLNV